SDLGSAAIVTKGLENCLFLYPREDWEKVMEKIAHLPLASASARAFTRMMTSGAMEVEIDKLGRTLLPAYLRDYASLEGETVLAGVLNRVEIWDRASWERYSQDTQTRSSDLAEELKDWEI
ncbi:MAG: division/cell wall cluster transcriptional repressor MraZ, partial [Patescibacteria group bacterium]